MNKKSYKLKVNRNSIFQGFIHESVVVCHNVMQKKKKSHKFINGIYKNRTCIMLNN